MNEFFIAMESYLVTMRKISLKKRLTYKVKSQKHRGEKKWRQFLIQQFWKQLLDFCVCFLNHLRRISGSFMDFVITRNICFLNCYFRKPLLRHQSSGLSVCSFILIIYNQYGKSLTIFTIHLLLSIHMYVLLSYGQPMQLCVLYLVDNQYIVFIV